MIPAVDHWYVHLQIKPLVGVYIGELACICYTWGIAYISDGYEGAILSATWKKLSRFKGKTNYTVEKIIMF